MSTIQGTGGGITLPSGYNAKVESWSASHEVLTTETTGFGDGGAEVHEPVYTKMSGSCAGTLQFDATNTAPLPGAIVDGGALTQSDLETNCKATLTLTATTGCTYAFTAIMTVTGFNRPEKDKATVTYNFISTGQITQAWDETA